MKKLSIIVTALALPLTSFAALENIRQLAIDIGGIVNTVIPIVFALALLGFFYGLVKYIFSGEHEKEAAKKTMIWGIVALFVMATVWGLVNWLGDAVGVDPTAAPSVGGLIPRN
jgi:LytS/YehU family sensor histidine kinase